MKRALKKDKGTFLENQAEEIRVADGTVQTGKMYHVIRSLDNKSKSLPGTILSKKANPILATAETLNRWAECFKELLNRPPVEPLQPRHFTEQPLATVWTTPPTFVGMKEAVHRLKNHKAAGTDNILPELYQHGGDSIPAALTQLMDLIWNQQAIPSEWNTAIIVPVHKKGDSRRCDNYRGISLLNVSFKICENIIIACLGTAIEEHARENQAGFGPKRGCRY